VSGRSKLGDARREREAVAKAMLITCGDLGYAEVAVSDVLERSGCSRVRFYRLFDGKNDCYAQAYRAGIERLGNGLMHAAAAAGDWRTGLRVALADLARFVTQQPLLAKGLLVEVHGAGEPALAERTRMLGRLSRAFDLAREEDGALSPPQITAEFLVSAIEAATVRSLKKDETERFAELVPELAHLVVMAYFGRDAARTEMAACR
jgi:AcrR family transcriptional regulator